MTEVGIKCLNFALGEQKVWYRTLDGIETKIAALGLMDAESFWGWGFFHRFACDYQQQVVQWLHAWIRGHSADAIDGVVICAPCRVSASALTEPLLAKVTAELGIREQEIRVVQGFDCVNIIKALDEARSMIATGCRNVLVLAAERAESEAKRFRKFALFSDACLAMVVSNDVAACKYELHTVEVREDPSPAATSDGILGRKLDAKLLRDTLAAAELDVDDIAQCYYINLYKPIAEMKAIDMGFDRQQHYNESVSDIGHCYGIDPFFSLSRHAAAVAADSFHALCASSKEHSGVAILSKR